MKDKSLEELNILKIVIYVLSFITVCTALILFLLLPVLKDYKQTHLRKNSQAAIFNAAKAKLDASENKISALRTENNKSLEQFEQQFNLTHFQNFLEKYFENIQITELKLDEKEKYLTHRINIRASINNPRRLYDFIDALAQYNNLVKIDYPMTLKASDHGIMINLNVQIYSN
ncbi:hypothetical protein ACM1FL_001132 [Campylobacter coli]|uniref:hypothetical protein n=1 Tax=Campylobacter coli TaxID=195 RepID=UPI002752ADCD|nr:hypothetical protein [Campylobacter coli]EEP3505468.1 hypothetical protein [Campylobacter coli]MDP8518675.1 hypothetical protein [Campylobacter coli]HEB7507527.1 hypothetical protein [Campylobacter coli]HED7348555.1 hypothetical protein [Campylobacter coli]HED7361814.1 hypothetical protein [Campylobacter coli]